MLRNALACLIAAVIVIAASSNAVAQDAPADPPVDPAPEDVAAKQEEAKKLFLEGLELEKAEDYDGAIAKYEAAIEAYADPLIYVRLGQAQQLRGNKGPDFDFYAKAVESYKKYLELVPEGDQATADEVNKRIATLEEALAEEEERKKKVIEDEKQMKLDEAREKREEEERKKKAKADLEKMRPAVDAVVVAGLDQDMTLAARLMAGGMLGWKLFALEAHISFEGMFPLAADKGTSGRSLTLLDLGVRIGNGEKNFTGIFASAGGGFGLFGGNPRERRIKDDPEQCMGFGDINNPNNCKFDVDKNITGRFGLGYGFAASKTTTVAARLDFTYWLLSVDGSQPEENLPAGIVNKPQHGFSLLMGLEFMRWL